SFESGNAENKFTSVKYKKEGKLVTWSVVNAAPNGFEDIKPYIIGIIELEDGERLTSQIIDIESNELQKGDILIPTFRKIYEDGKDGIIHYGLKWMKA
nr:OB-fold domain-containing protein [Candidatus Dojkabacteria bacterium]